MSLFYEDIREKNFIVAYFDKEKVERERAKQRETRKGKKRRRIVEEKRKEEKV